MKKGAAALILLLLLGFAAYLSLSLYYYGGFSYGTWIGGVYCAGKSVEEVNRELAASWEAPEITVVDKNGEEYKLPLDQAGCTADFTDSLKQYLEAQNPFLWPMRLFSGQTAQEDGPAGTRADSPGGSLSPRFFLRPEITFRRDLLRNLWEELPPVQEERSRDRNLRIELTEEGYRLFDGLNGRLDTEEGFLALCRTVSEGGGALKLEESGCYADILPDPEQLSVLALWEKIERFQDSGIIYDMGDRQIPLDASVTWQFLNVHEDGSLALNISGDPVIDEEGIAEFINALAEEYNTYGKERQFTATRGDVVTVKGGTYGTRLDTEAETAYLIRAFAEKRREIHVPAYRQEGFSRGRDDIGDTYIEVDMTDQKLYYYQDGECLVETDVVTGHTGLRRGTPEGVNYVYAKQRNRILRGPGYASPVKYWMPVKGNIGIHDAGWRSKFGGEIYKKDGSHGCINLPREKMSELFDLVEIGTPVVMFY